MENYNINFQNSFQNSDIHFEDIAIRGGYSIDSDCNFHNDFSELRYLYSGYSGTQILDQPLDLNQDNDKITPRLKECSSQLDIENLSKWLKTHIKEAENVDFVFPRGIFQGPLLKCLVERNLDFKIAAYRINDTIYLCSQDTDILREERENRSPTMAKFSLWGYKFEHLLLSDDPQVKPDGKGELKLGSEIYAVFHARLRKFNLLYTGEMDAIIKETKMSPSDNLEEFKRAEFIEVKSCKEHSLNWQKMLKWWAQCHLSGVKKIVCGVKDENKIVALEQISVDQIIPKIKVKLDGRQMTEANLCNFYADVLQYIQDQMYSVDPETYCLFEWNPTDEDTITARTTEEEEYKFLPPEFIDLMKSHGSARSSGYEKDTRSSANERDARSSTNETDTRSSTNEGDTGSSTNETDTRSSTNETDTRSSTNEGDTGSSTNETDTRSSTNETDTGSLTNETDTRSSANERDAGSSRYERDTRSSTNEADTRSSTNEADTGSLTNETDTRSSANERDAGSSRYERDTRSSTNERSIHMNRADEYQNHRHNDNVYGKRNRFYGSKFYLQNEYHTQRSLEGNEFSEGRDRSGRHNSFTRNYHRKEMFGRENRYFERNRHSNSNEMSRGGNNFERNRNSNSNEMSRGDRYFERNRHSNSNEMSREDRDFERNRYSNPNEMSRGGNNFEKNRNSNPN